jgi:hypothetical protein
MNWIKEHLTAIVGSGVTAVLLLLWQGRHFLGWIAARLNRVVAIYKTDTELIEGQGRLVGLLREQLNTATAACTRLEREAQELAKDLKEETRKVMIRNDINTEDRAYIRALTMRLRQKGIDYGDINAEFKRDD